MTARHGLRLRKLLLLSLPLAVTACVFGLSSTGETATQLLLDPGDLVRYGLPITQVVHDLAAALTVGLLVLAAGVLPGQGQVRGVVSSPQSTATRWAARCASVWLATAAAVIVLTTANATGEPVTSPSLPRQVLSYVTTTELGQYLGVSLLLVAFTLFACLFARRMSVVGAACVLSVLALLPLALSGHAAGSDEHLNAVNSLAIHLVAVCVWVGGLIALVLIRPRLDPQGLTASVRRYSTLAAWCWAATAFSGLVNASLRLNTPSDLVASPYGRLILLKVVALVALGAAGAWQRRSAIPHLGGPRGRRTFARIAVGEVLVMAVTFGLSVALSRSAPPVPQTPITYDPQHALLGFTYPPPVSVTTYLTRFQPDWLFLAISAVAVGLYLTAVRRLRRRGDTWPIGRTISWLLGCLMLAWVTSGGPGLYGSVHFSTHMLLHMGLMMYVPLPLVLGAPILLALRALPTRDDHSRGPREWLLTLVHSRYVAVLSKPAVAGVIFAGSLIVFYFTGWFEYALFEHPGHLLMQVHFLLSGYLFFWVLIGIDPGPARASHPIRLVTLLATMAFHAFFGVAVMGSNQILAEQWWTVLGAGTTAELLRDQEIGGSIAWGAGELPVVIAALIVAVQWARDDERRARRLDRQADRDGDAELARYNEYLQGLAKDRHMERRTPLATNREPDPQRPT